MSSSTSCSMTRRHRVSRSPWTICWIGRKRLPRSNGRRKSKSSLWIGSAATTPHMERTPRPGSCSNAPINSPGSLPTRQSALRHLAHSVGNCRVKTISTRGDALIQEGLRELPDQPQYAIRRVDCLRFGSDVSRAKGESGEAVRRMEIAQRTLREWPLNADTLELANSVDLASAYREAGRDREALAEFEHAGTLLSAFGREKTETAVRLYDAWALELDQLGRPLEAEKVFRHVIDISRDNLTEEAVSPMVLNNYARVLRELNRLPQAADYAERAYNKAVKTGDGLVINQSLLERARTYLAQHDLPRAEAMFAEVEPRLRTTLPPGHFAFAAVSSGRGLIAMENGDLPAALRLMDQAIATVQTSLKSGKGGAYMLPVFLHGPVDNRSRSWTRQRSGGRRSQGADGAPRG